ncbi:SDR family oxidoreductase [Amycolatopsis sp. NPDC024027]|uniref:SDR family oxidoreductase n=1 Tax=Amycolatopsis sp. NPDC024027 TaxID=3154327 RepID=UPI0033EE1BDB
MNSDAPRGTAGEFAGRVVLVTGGGKGVGRAIVREFAAAGAHVLINYFHSAEAARRTLEEVVAAGGSGDVIRASVARTGDVTAMMDRVREQAGRLDVLVNNAARGVLAPAGTLSDLEWQKVFDVNVHGARRCAWAALPLLAGTGGVVVNVSSIGAGMVVDNYATVGVSKAALEALSRYLAVEFARHGVRVNVASAGLLDNPTADLFPGGAALRDTCGANAPLGRLGTEAELARLVTVLASPRMSWVTGQSVLADGGLSLGHAMLRPGPPAPARPLAPVTTREERPDAGADAEVGAVAVVGMGLVLPGADSPEEFWELLRRGKPVFGEPRERFRDEAFRESGADAPDRAYTFRGGYIRRPRLHEEAGASSCAHDFAAQWLRHSIAQAYDPVVRRPDDRVECFVANTVEGNQQLDESLFAEVAVQRLIAHWPDGGFDRSELSGRLRALLRRHYPLVTGEGRQHLPDRVAEAAITGLLPPGSPYTTVDTACSSSLYAVDLGAKALASGACDAAVCGGVFTNTPRFSVMFSALRGLSRSGGLHAFDRDADGTLFSDGAAAVVLKSLRRARLDGDEVLAVLGGSGVASDGRGKAVYAPNPAGQDRAVRRARNVNGTPAADVDWIVAHGTGTPVGDRVELGVLAELADGAGYACTSNKSLVGHTGWPAGAVSLIHALLGLRHGVVPAQRPPVEPAPDAPGERVRIPAADLPLPRREDRPRVVGVSAFGFGGTDAHLLLQDAPRPGGPVPRSVPRADADETVLVAWTAHLPGEPSADEVRARLAAGAAPAPEASFPTPYPVPEPRALRMAPRTVQTLDRTQLMALAVAARFAEEHGPLWEAVRDRAGIVAAHTGPTSAAGLTAFRCYAGDLASLTPRPGDGISAAALEQALRDCLDEVRRERPATNEDTLPGLGPNIIPARLANRLDLHGPTLTIDTGRSSTLTAVHTAARYLATGELDLALVLALNGNSTPEWAALLGEPAGKPAEGAFLFALARKRDAQAHGWPVLATVTTEPRPGGDASAAERPPRDRTYLGADGAIDLLTALVGPSAGPVTVTGPFPGPAVTVHPVGGSGDVAGVAVSAAAVVSESPPAGPVTVAGPFPGPAVTVDPVGGSGDVAGVAGSAPVVPDAPGDSVAGPPASPVVPEPPRDPVTTRCVPRLEPAAPPPETPDVLPAGCLVLTDEATAAVLAAPAAAAAAATVVVRPDDDPEAVLAPVLDANREYRHLRACTSRPEAAPALQEAVFVAARHCRDALGAGGSVGALLVDPLGRGVPEPHAGLFTGLVNSVAWELPGCVCRVLITDEPAGTSWRHLEAELARPGGLPSVVRRAGVRYRPRLRPAPSRAGELPLAPGDVVVATGGARGITAAAVEGLLERLPLRVWLLGSSAPQDVPAGLLAAGEEDVPRHRAAFIAEGRRSGATVAELTRRFDRLLRARESRLTLDRLRRHHGAAAVHHLTCDVTDPDAVRTAVRTVLDRDGRVDLLINGAGAHHPGDLSRKQLARFRHVRDVKLRGYHHLKRAFEDSPPRLWCNFGSLAGLMGLPGEADYSAANDFLVRAAEHQARTEEFTVAWTVWDGAGISGDPATRAALARSRRLSSMSRAEGVAHFLTELAQPGPRDPVVSFIGRAERELLARKFPGYADDGPGVKRAARFLAEPETRDAATATWTVVFDSRRERYLHEHLVDGKPTVPGTLLAGIAVEAARALLPGAAIHALRGVSFTHWVRARADRPVEYRVRAEVRHGDDPGRPPAVLVRLTSDVVAPRGQVLSRDREHFRATVLTGPRRTPAAPPPAGETGHPVESPYYHPESRVSLAGTFRTTHEGLAGPWGAAALWRPAGPPVAFGGPAVPILLLDGLLRTRALRPVDGENAHQVEAPRHLGLLEWFTEADDVELAGRYPEGIHLRWDATTGVFSATAPDGTPLARIEDARCASMGRVEAAGVGVPT